MKVIEARNVNDAWHKGIKLIDAWGVPTDSRNGRVLVMPVPVTTRYLRPVERVLFDPVRDANPFFHFFEGLWMLAGRNDADWLDVFVKDFSSRFAEDGGVMHGAYGKRWRNWFGKETNEQTGIGDLPVWNFIDQLNIIVGLLTKDPKDRQAVLQMWSAEDDLGVPGLKDRPCNTQIYFRADMGVLDMTVTCRSNDMVYGAYGANAVHMSMLQEYMAARIGIAVGSYWQMSNNFHVYDWSRKAIDAESAWADSVGPYPGTRPLVDDPLSFDSELNEFLADPKSPGIFAMRNAVFKDARKMWFANEYRKKGDIPAALSVAFTLEAPDWHRACCEWLMRRQKK